MQDNGQGDALEHDPERQHLRLRKDREDGSFHAQCYDEMRAETFWEELVIRMSDRELVRSYGQHKMDAMGQSERRAVTEPINKRYWEEFSTNGIENLHLVSRAQNG